MQILKYYSPNFNNKKRTNKTIKLLVFHYTGMQSERESLKRLSNPKSNVSCHYLINRRGKIYGLAHDNYIAWHAGKSCWGKFKNLNKSSIGIELVNKGHRWGYTKFTKLQISSLLKLCKILKKKYYIKNKYIVGHSDIAPNRKIDPGEKFPWKYLAKKNIGIWHTLKINKLKKLRKMKIYEKKDKINFFRNLKKIGYCVSPNSSKAILDKTLLAYQRRFRKELVNGVLDAESMVISANLAKKL